MKYCVLEYRGNNIREVYGPFPTFLNAQEFAGSFLQPHVPGENPQTFITLPLVEYPQIWKNPPVDQLRCD